MQIIDSCERSNRLDFIPKAGTIRLDPVFSDVLDFLIDSCYVKVIWKYQTPSDEPDSDFFDSDSDVLALTESGRRLLNVVVEFLQMDEFDYQRLVKESIAL